MNTAVVYPYIVRRADEFRPDFERFVETFEQFPPESPHILILTVCNGVEIALQDLQRADLFSKVIRYNGDGFDIGAHQHVANALPEDIDFVVFCSSQVHFHRAGWLQRMVEAREKFGPGLYGGIASYENRPHLRTCFFGCDPADMRAYPTVINTKELSLQFESGREGFGAWMRDRQRKEVWVAWDAFYDDDNDWRTSYNGFRQGDQSNCLVWDRHTQVYERASPHQKIMLQRVADGKPIEWHSQFGEDKWLFENGYCDLPGVFCEIGAFDGVSSSNTFAFEKMGWKGTCVEPDVENAYLCRANRKASTVNCAIGLGPSVQKFLLNLNDRGTSALKRLETGHFQFVPVCRLDDLFRMTDAPDLLSIDTEGTELEVWATIGDFRPRIVIMEFWTQPNPPRPEEIIEQMAKDGYREIHCTEANLIFLKI